MKNGALAIFVMMTLGINIFIFWALLEPATFWERVFTVIIGFVFSSVMVAPFRGD